MLGCRHPWPWKPETYRWDQDVILRVLIGRGSGATQAFLWNLKVAGKLNAEKASNLIVVQRAQCLDAKPRGNDASHHVEDRHEHIQNKADVRVVKGNANT